MNVDFSERDLTIASSGNHRIARTMFHFYAWPEGEIEAGSWTGQAEYQVVGTEYWTAQSMQHGFFFPREIKFARLMQQWYVERNITSSLSEMNVCPSYIKIIAMGEPALPLIFEQLRKESDDPDYWFAALEAITGHDPVPEDAYGDTRKMAEAWLLWAERENVW